MYDFSITGALYGSPWYKWSMWKCERFPPMRAHFSRLSGVREPAVCLFALLFFVVVGVVAVALLLVSTSSSPARRRKFNSSSSLSLCSVFCFTAALLAAAAMARALVHLHKLQMALLLLPRFCAREPTTIGPNIVVCDVCACCCLCCSLARAPFFCPCRRPESHECVQRAQLQHTRCWRR